MNRDRPGLWLRWVMCEFVVGYETVPTTFHVQKSGCDMGTYSHHWYSFTNLVHRLGGGRARFYHQLLIDSDDTVDCRKVGMSRNVNDHLNVAHTNHVTVHRLGTQAVVDALSDRTLMRGVSLHDPSWLGPLTSSCRCQCLLVTLWLRLRRQKHRGDSA